MILVKHHEVEMHSTQHQLCAYEYKEEMGLRKKDEHTRQEQPHTKGQ
ncbi:MAG: hypothetical protein AAFU83_03965 [Bacteroidota bacterium]